MGLIDAGGLSRSALMTAIVESTPLDRTLAHVAADSVKHVSYSHTPNEERELRRDVRPGRDDISVKVRDRTNEWSAGFEFLPRGAAVPPDAAPFWRGLMGLETIGGSSVTYGYARVPPSLGIIVTAGEPTPIAQEKQVGALVNQGVITLARNVEPRIVFSGMSAESIRALGTMTIGAGATSANQAVLTDHAARVKVGSIVNVVGVSVNRRITARNAALTQVTLDSSITTAGGEIVRPYTPWDESTTNQGGEPIRSWSGAISIAGVTSHIIQGATINIGNNWQEKRHQFSQYFVDAYAGHRSVSGTLRISAEADDIILLAEAEEPPAATPGTINPVALIFTLGDATLGQCVITLPNCVLNFGAISFPEDGGLATFEIPFIGLSTRTSGVPNNDAITAVWS